MKYVSSSSISTEKTNAKCLTRKHIAERQRRARINQLLEQLETLILPPDSEPCPVKLEKAEVLEKTVDYIKHQKSSVNHGSRTGYANGYKECLRRLVQYLDTANLAQVQKDHLQSYLLSQQVSTEMSATSPESNTCYRIKSNYQSTRSYTPAQTFKQEPEIRQCQNQPMESAPYHHLMFSSPHLSPSSTHISESAAPITYNNWSLHSGLNGHLPSDTHFQIMNSRVYSSLEQICDQPANGMSDSNVWRPW